MPGGVPSQRVLAVADLNTYRAHAHILRNVALWVGQREVVCLVGRNGAGKTTTMDSLMGLLPIRSGRIELNGKDITRMPAHARAIHGIGYAPEDCGIFPDLTATENLGIAEWLAGGGKGNGETGSALEHAYEVFPELNTFLSRRGLYLSGGEKKMLAIARAMTLRPSILLLDEAFEGLAPVVVQRFADAVQKIKALGISLLIAESNIVSAAKVAERVYVIDRGEILFEGTPQAAFENETVMKTIRG